MGGKKMDLLVGIGLSVGVLAGLWGQFSGGAGLITWVAFVSWACFYAAGGNKEGLLKTIPANISGVLWGMLMVYGAQVLGFEYALGTSIAVCAFFMCVQAKWSVLSFIPGAFAGCSCYFGSNLNWQGAMIALVLGAVLGYISETGGVLLSTVGQKKDVTV